MPRMMTLNLTVNDKPVSLQTEPDRSLLELLREDLQLTGTKYGCGEGACGACAVLINGKKTFSCLMAVSDTDGKSITTIEGLGSNEVLHPAQQAFLQTEAFQCGYCTPGLIIGTVALLERKPQPSDDEIKDALNGHLCRCCGYARVCEAVKKAAELSKAT
jgi:aerobic-type carbon monoxide dehydrogenase small subunit (CoxS/CutS family)